jgi:hypothetical protein
MRDVIISILHLAFLGFVVLVPFYGNSYLRLIHTIVIPFVMAHWIMNNNTCALTLMEKKIREHLQGGDVSRKECFVGNLIEPVYDFVANNQDYSTIIYVVTLLLWSIGTFKLYNTFKSGQIKSAIDLLRV